MGNTPTPTTEIPIIKAKKQKKVLKSPESEKEFYLNQTFHVAKKGLNKLKNEIGDKLKDLNFSAKITKEKFSLSHLLRDQGINIKQRQLIYALLSQQNFIVDRFYEGDEVSIKNGKFSLISKHLNKRFIGGEKKSKGEEISIPLIGDSETSTDTNEESLKEQRNTKDKLLDPATKIFNNYGKTPSHKKAENINDFAD